MTREEAIEAVDTYIQALKSGNYSSVRFSPSVSFLGPLHDEPLQGKEAIDFETNSGAILPIADYIKMEAGQIVHIRPFFDPRPLLGA